MSNRKAITETCLALVSPEEEGTVAFNARDIAIAYLDQCQNLALKSYALDGKHSEVGRYRNLCDNLLAGLAAAKLKNLQLNGQVINLAKLLQISRDKESR